MSRTKAIPAEVAPCAGCGDRTRKVQRMRPGPLALNYIRRFRRGDVARRVTIKAKDVQLARRIRGKRC